MRVCGCWCVCVFNWLPHRKIESLMDHLRSDRERWRDGRAGGGHRSWGTVCQAGELETSAVVWLLVFPRLPDGLSYTQQRYELGHKRCSSRLWGRGYICPLSWKKDSGHSLLLLQFQLMWFSSGTRLNKTHNLHKAGESWHFIYIYLPGWKKKSCQSVACVSNTPQIFVLMVNVGVLLGWDGSTEFLSKQIHSACAMATCLQVLWLPSVHLHN